VRWASPVATLGSQFHFHGNKTYHQYQTLLKKNRSV